MSNTAFQNFVKRHPGPYASQLSNFRLGGTRFDIFCRGSRDFLIFTDASAGEQKGKRNSLIVSLALNIMRDDPHHFEVDDNIATMLDEFQTDYPGPYTSREILDDGFVNIVTTNLTYDGFIVSCLTEIGNHRVANITASIAEALNNLFDRL